MYADDTVLFSKSVSGLRSMLDTFDTCVHKWDLSVNTNKTKIVIFRKSGNIKISEEWFYKDMKMKIVNTFTYLGLLFNYDGSFLQTQKKLGDQGRKAPLNLFNRERGGQKWLLIGVGPLIKG